MKLWKDTADKIENANIWARMESKSHKMLSVFYSKPGRVIQRTVYPTLEVKYAQWKRKGPT